MKNFILLLFSCIIFSACSKNLSIGPGASLNSYNKKVIEYFNEVALGFEFGNASNVTRKYNGQKMKVFVGGTPTVALNEELLKISTEINALASDGFSIEVVQDSTLSNFYVYFGAGNDYAQIYPSQKSLIANNFGLFSVFWNSKNNLTKGHMYVDIFRTPLNAQRHLLREELTQSLGLARDSNRYLESIFQQSWTTTTFYDPIDKELIRLLYHPKMKSGLNNKEVETVLEEILLAEQKAL